jgi:hypothetical protein
MGGKYFLKIFFISKKIQRFSSLLRTQSDLTEKEQL